MRMLANFVWNYTQVERRGVQTILA